MAHAKTRMDKLRKLCPGSVTSKPKIIWVLMINQPLIKNHPFHTYNYVVELRTALNQLLEKQARKIGNSLVCELADETFTPNTFDSTGNLTFEGKKSYWRYLDNQIKSYKLNSHIHLMPWLRNNMRTTGNKQRKGTEQFKAPSLNQRNQNWERGWTNEYRQNNRQHTKSDEDIWGEAARMSSKRNRRY